MFVNLMLVAEGIFEPTHTTRVRAWFSMSGVEHQPLVSLALAVKTGASVSGLEKNYAAFEMCAVRMRTQLKAKIAALPIISDAVGIGGHFWFDANELPQSVTSRNALIAIAEILIGMLCGSLVAQFIDDPKSAAQYPKMLSELREIATENWNTEPLQTISRINALRFRYSRVSHRDWGTW